MIPIKLELKNFMSYGEDVQPLDLTGMHLACLSGDNGNGKSALLDAITWALWGKARASDDELIRLGTEEAQVIFHFRLGDDMYRVIRARSRKNVGSSMWEVYIADGGGERSTSNANPDNPKSEIRNPKSPNTNHLTPATWRPITGQGIRDTGRVIQRILRMDYDTFINSAYIQQGRADEFTKQAVGKRKEILADILDLSRYDVLEQKAKERRNESDLQVKDLEREIAEIQDELAHEPEYESRLVENKAQREKVEAEIKSADSSLRKLYARDADLQSKKNRLQEMERSVQGLQADIVNLRTQKTEQERRVARSREALADKERITAGMEELCAARERVVDLDKRLQELRKLEHEKSGLEQQILAEKHKLELERQSLAKELAELETRVVVGTKQATEASSLREQVAKLDELDKRRSQLQVEAARESERWTDLKSRYERMLQVKEELDGKVKMLGESAECPLCQTELGHDKHSAIVADYASRIKDADARIGEFKREGADAKNKRDAAQKECADIDAQLKAGLEVRRRLAQVEQIVSQAEQHAQQLPEIKARLEVKSKTLAEDTFALEQRTKLVEIVASISKLQYSPEEHQRVREELSSLAEFESLAAALQLAEEGLPADEQSLKTTEALMGAREASIRESEAATKELSAALADLPALTTEIAEISKSLAVQRQTDREVTGRIATLEQSLARCKTLRTESMEKVKGLENARADRSVYTDLTAAFGKKGVQALIIENAIPEIQEETNRLLSRMTDNAMQISIETVREKKTGGAAETLDIRISDDMGTRAYELYSGGEAFRVNFALRIALSKLLARRAGARLQTLIIDEGFGTQDGKGREKLVEAIDSIKEDFELILVITHIDELKDAFPTRIEISKDTSGSQISVL